MGDKFAIALTFTIVFVLSCINQVSAKYVEKKYRDCHERWRNGEYKAGVYNIYPNGKTAVKAYCNHSVDATFTVLQRRYSGTESFYRNWNDYKVGFGNPQGDYWIGLDTMHHLTAIGNQSLRIDMQDWAGNSRYIIYSQFYVYDEANYYRLIINQAYGNVPDDMSFSNGMYFYTPDRHDPHGCAQNMHSGWWYNYCAYAHLNGVYHTGGPYAPTQNWYDGIFWKDWGGYGYSLKFVSMSLNHGSPVGNLDMIAQNQDKYPKEQRRFNGNTL